MSSIILSGGAANVSSRPALRTQAIIAPPFDPDDPDGQVHTTLPPEQVIPPHFADPLFMRADFNGVTLDLNRWNPKAPQPLPFLVGANSTPLAMLMTPMLIMYPRYWQDADLTEHAERGLDDFVIATNPWNAEENGFDYNDDIILAWMRYVKRTWGFRVVLWQGGRPPDQPSTLLRKALDTDLVNFYIHGKEVNTQMSAEDFEASLHTVNDYIGGRIPIGAHFSADGNRHLGYPQSAPPYLTDWSPFDGRVHLMQQLDGYGPDGALCLAGRQGAAMYYGRKRVNLGAAAGEGGQGPGAPNSRVIAFETMATAELYGDCDENYGVLRQWELLCGTRNDPRVRPVSGSGNGRIQDPTTGRIL